MPPKAKRQKKAKPAFVVPPGGGALETRLPGRLLKDNTGDVARWWPNNKPGKAAFLCNVQGVSWAKRYSKWQVRHTSADTNKWAYLGHFAAFADACAARAAAVDGNAIKGTLEEREDGQLCVSHCVKAGCSRTLIPATEFAPDVFKYKKEFSEYANALALLVHGLTPATRAKIDKGRRSLCLPCRGVLRKSNTEGEHNEEAKCRRVIEEIKAKWVLNGGCKVCGCLDTDVLSGDHEDRQGKDDHRQRLGAAWWRMHGGAEALREHYLGPHSTVKCKCLFCHSLESSHSIHEGADPEDLAEGSNAKLQRDYITKKQAHVNEEKKRRGKCEHSQCCDPFTLLPRVVGEGTYHAFHFAHKDEVDKKFGIADMVGNRQSPATAIPKLDKEMPKCNLYCANCHMKYDTIPRRKEGQELLDALLARGAPVGALVCEVCE